MLRSLFCLLLGISLFTPVVAHSSDSYPIITKDELRSGIYAHDFRTVENTLADGQAMYLKGEATHDDLRWLFEVFATTNPKVISFTKDWLHEYRLHKLICETDQGIGC